MKEFIITALPWICAALALAFCAVNFSKEKKAKKDGEAYGNFMSEGMCIGMCVAMALGTEYLCYGILLGMAVGINIKK